MNNLGYALLIIFILILLWVWYSPTSQERLKMKVGAPYGYYLKEGQDHPQKGMSQHENMVNQMDWANMSRGLNVSNAGGYTPTIRMLSEMEKSNSGDIQTDSRSMEEGM